MQPNEPTSKSGLPPTDNQPLKTPEPSSAVAPNNLNPLNPTPAVFQPQVIAPPTMNSETLVTNSNVAPLNSAQPNMNLPFTNNVAMPNQALQPSVDSYDELVGLSASQLKNQKTKMPIGIYVLVAYLFIGFLLSFYGAKNLLYTILSILDLVLVICLLFRVNVVRKIIIWCFVIDAVLLVVVIAMLFHLERQVDNNMAKVETGITNVVNEAAANSNITPIELSQIKQKAASADAILSSGLSKDHDQFIKAYVRSIVGIVSDGVIIVYLKRPKVKAAFQKD
ncbi:MAG: hypothetical protein ABSB12_00855 [Candidatus Saccharimonadales bacterium]|jgi:hypothetical protein